MLGCYYTANRTIKQTYRECKHIIKDNILRKTKGYKYSVFKMQIFLKIHIYLFHISSFLLKRGMNIQIQGDFYRTMT